MSIRRKLFFAFVAAAAVPLLALGVLARLYAQRERAALDQQFVEEARSALKRLDDVACTREDYLREAIASFVEDLDDGRIIDAKVMIPELQENPGVAAAVRLTLSTAMSALAKKSQAIAQIAEHARLIDQKLLGTHVAGFRDKHPSVLGIQILVDGVSRFSDVPGPIEIDRRITLHPMMQKSVPDAELYRLKNGALLFKSGPVEDTQLFVEIDPRWLFSAEPFLRDGRAVYVMPDGRTQLRPDEPEPEMPIGKILAQSVLADGESGRVTVEGRNWWVYRGASADHGMFSIDLGGRSLAIICEDQLYRPVARFQLALLAAIFFSLLFAVGLSYYLSGRFVESVENLKRGVDALSRGEFSQLEKSSADELGSELVESMNRMASALAERTRKEEIESWRRLVRVLSHEINNTLGPVKSVASTVRDNLAPKLEGETGEDLKSSFKLIVDRVDSLSSFISGYAVLAKLPAPEKVPSELNEVVRGGVSILKNGVPIDEVYDPKVGLVPVDKEQIERVVINLVKNAIEAARSRVSVRTELRGDMVEIRVEDDGPGIAAEARPHLFVPYYTTKPGGSGIGLALARQIVLGHGGTVGTQDRDGGGTIVSVFLPTSAM